MNTIGIHANLGKAEVRDVLPQLIDWLAGKDVKAIICGELGNQIDLDSDQAEIVC